MEREVIEHLLDIKSSLTYPENNSKFDEQISFLGSVINQTGANELERQRLAQSSQIWKILLECIGVGNNNVLLEDTNHIRLFRAILVLVRNLIINFPQGISNSILLELLQNFNQFITNCSRTNPFFEKTIEIYFQIIANSPYKQNDDDIESKEVIFQVNRLLESIDYSKLNDLIILALKPILRGTDEETYHNLNLYHVLKSASESTMAFLLDSFNKVDFDQPLSHFSVALVGMLYDVITHESFGKWIQSKQEEASLIPWLELSQLVVTSKEDWNNYQLTSLLSWNSDLFILNSKKAINQLDNKDIEYSEDLEITLNILLDILGDLCKYNQSKQYLAHYSLLDHLVAVLKAVHENVKPITIKDREKYKTVSDSDIRKSELGRQMQYPHVKSLAIEIISYLVHDSFESQEKVRHLGGLALILSNCIIDENNPFIKERSIMCLKFLLANNPENQKFVAELEAKKVVDDDVLQDAGYEVDIKDGNFAVKKKLP